MKKFASLEFMNILNMIYTQKQHITYSIKNKFSGIFFFFLQWAALIFWNEFLYFENMTLNHIFSYKSQ